MPAEPRFDRQPLDDELVDDELAYDNDMLDEAEVEHASSRLASPRYFLPTMALLGVILALGWHYSGARAWFDGPKPVVQAAAVPAVPAAAPAESELARAMAEIEALKKSIADLRATNQQMATTISTLQAAQEDLRQQVSAARSAPAPVPVHTATAKPPKPKAAATGSIPARAANAHTAAKPPGQVPLSLTAPRP